MRGTGLRPAGMISIEGMNLNVDDWHGRPPCWFDQLSAIVTGLHRVMSAATSGDVIRGMPSGLAVTTAVRRSQRITLLHRLTLAEHVYANQNGRHGADHPTSTIATRQPEQQREDRGTGQRTDLAE